MLFKLRNFSLVITNLRSEQFLYISVIRVKVIIIHFIYIALFMILKNTKTFT